MWVKNIFCRARGALYGETPGALKMVTPPSLLCWNEAPRYLIRDQDGIYGAAVARRLQAMGIRNFPWSSQGRFLGRLRVENLS
jgi:hypothetical protein